MMKKGFTLLEMTVALVVIALVSIAIVGVMGAITRVDEGEHTLYMLQKKTQKVALIIEHHLSTSPSWSVGEWDGTLCHSSVEMKGENGIIYTPREDLKEQGFVTSREAKKLVDSNNDFQMLQDKLVFSSLQGGIVFDPFLHTTCELFYPNKNNQFYSLIESFDHTSLTLNSSFQAHAYMIAMKSQMFKLTHTHDVLMYDNIAPWRGDITQNKVVIETGISSLKVVSLGDKAFKVEVCANDDNEHVCSSVRGFYANP